MDEWVWSNGEMILTGENWSTGRKTLYSVGGRWMNEYGAMVEWYWQGKTEVLGEKRYTVWVVDEWVSMEEWWNDTDKGNLKYLEKNLTKPSRTHSCRGKGISITNSECVFAALFIQHAKRMNYIKTRFCGGNVMHIKLCFVFLYNFPVERTSF